MTEVVDLYLTAPPPAPLLGRVATLSGWEQAGTPPQVHRGLPSPWLTFIVTLHDPLVVAAHPDPAQPADRYEALLCGGARGVAEVAAAIGWSPRRLHARCRVETGLAPQELRRVARFDRARRALAAGAPPAAVAADHGYVDQAHLTREVTRFAGLPPRRWLAAERRSLQDTDRRPTPGSPA